MGMPVEGAARPHQPSDGLAGLRWIERLLGCFARRGSSKDGRRMNRHGPNGNGSRSHPAKPPDAPAGAAASGGAAETRYDAFAQGLAFGRKELARVNYERKVLPDKNYPGFIVDHGSGLSYDEYAFGVEAADDPYDALAPDDRAQFGPPPGS
jgi:hypothetical protein